MMFYVAIKLLSVNQDHNMFVMRRSLICF